MREAPIDLRSHVMLAGLVAIAMIAPIACATGPIAAARAADELPRYKLKVGQELVYKRADEPEESEYEGKTYLHKHETDWNAWVIRQNADSSWRLVFSEHIAVSDGPKDGEQSKQELSSSGYFDLFPDGRLIENRTIQPVGDPTVLFPKLPPDKQSLASSWESNQSLDETTRVFTAPAGPPSGETWTIAEKPHSALDAIYLWSRERRYTFDCDRGLVREVEETTKQEWPKRDKQPVPTRIQLVESKQLDTAEAEALTKEMGRYLTALDAYQSLMQQVRHEYRHTAELLDKAESILEKLEPQLHTAATQSLAKSLLEQCRRDRQYELENANQFKGLIDKPSPDWKTKDLGGSPHALKDYRGRVVVLDFWYRGCGWCMRAMPQIKQLAEEFADQPVAILGMNSDEEESNARFVVDRLELNYPTLKNGTGDDAINKKYQVNGYPTLVIIDPQGIVRDFHWGYSPTLREDVGRMIRELLAVEKQTAAKE